MALDETEINIDQLLDQENSHNKTEAWNKLNKTLKKKNNGHKNSSKCK